MKTFISRGATALRLPQKTSFVASRENMGKDAKDSDQVTRSRFEPSVLMRWRAKVRPLGSWRFDAKMIRRESGWRMGAKCAAPVRVACVTPVPTGRMAKLSRRGG